jgi:dephospho-CoA kinase
MKLLGVTGGLAMGKSMAATFFRRMEIPVVDTDDLARQLVRAGQPALEEIVARFGDDLLDEHGELKRSLLAARVFPDARRLRELESILHPPIREQWLATTAQWRQEGHAIGAVIITLLFETTAEESFDAILCLACSEATQLDRLRARGWTEDQIAQRLSHQWPVATKIAKADYVIWTDVPERIHQDQLSAVLAHESGFRGTDHVNRE